MGDMSQFHCQDISVPFSKDKITKRDMMNLFETVRLRFALTPKCNLSCFFCSNEGLNYQSKKFQHADINLVIRLSELLINNSPLRSIDFSGGEPVLNYDLQNRKSALLEWSKKVDNVKFSIHSNGVLLDKNIIDQLAGHFSRIGISLHSANFSTWLRMTGISNRKMWDQLMDNLKYINQIEISDKVFMKSVVIRGYNDSPDELRKFLDFCLSFGFNPKFLQFDPQFASQLKLRVGRKELFEKLESLGCEFSTDAPRHNNPETYIPATVFQYRNNISQNSVKVVHVILECGTVAACSTCYKFLCFFVKPSKDGSRLYLKPCSVLDQSFDVTDAVLKGDFDELMNVFIESREYLKSGPGVGISHWGKSLPNS